MKLIAATLGLATFLFIQQTTQTPTKPAETKPATPATAPASTTKADDHGHVHDQAAAPVVLPKEFDDATLMAKPAEEVFKNITFFKGKPASALRDAMNGMKEATAHDCVACHDTSNWADQTKRNWKIGLQMLQLNELANSTLYPNNPTKIGCWTCHRGKEEPDRLDRIPQGTVLPIQQKALDLIHLTDEQAALPAEQVFKNIQVLKGTPAGRIGQAMVFASRSLGVSCSHCHDEKALHAEKPEKNTARRMFAMVAKSKETIYANERNTRMNCSACHHGKPEPEEFQTPTHKGM